MKHFNNYLLLLFVLLTSLFFTSHLSFAQDQSFQGLPWTGTQELAPDPVIAIGTNNVVLIVNSTIGIYTKTGTQLSSTSLQTWFSSKNPPGTPFDSKIVYDNMSNRWVIVSVANNIR